MSLDIPDKSYFKIGEVSRILGVEPYNIRYWESQFRVVKPSKTKSRQRLYRRKDIELLEIIKQLLYEEGYTIAGAKKRLKVLLEQGESNGVAETRAEPGLTQEERRAYDEQLAKSQSELFELRAEVNTLQQELTRQRDEHATQLTVYERDRTALVERLRAAEEWVATLGSGDGEDGLAAAETRWAEERSALEARIAELEETNRDLLDQVSRGAESQAQVAALRERLAAQEERLRGMTADADHLRARFQRLAGRLRSELEPLVEGADS